jgi:hypothetical protein
MGIRHGWSGAKALVAAGVLVGCVGCVINAPSTPPEKVTPPASASHVPTPSAVLTTPPRDSPTSSAPARRTLTGPGTYSFSYEGAVGTIQVPANIKDPRLEPYGDYRRLANARPITYLIAQVDNQSDDPINMYEVVVVTNDGQQIEATSISDYVDMWRDAFAGEGGDARNYGRGSSCRTPATSICFRVRRGLRFSVPRNRSRRSNECSSTQPVPSIASRPKELIRWTRRSEGSPQAYVESAG